MNYDLQFLESAGIASDPRPLGDDRRHRAIFWRIAIPLLLVVDVVVLIEVVRLVSSWIA